MLAFYGDGSGEHSKGTPGPMLVAGYLGRMGDMWELERRWTNELNRHPKIAYFKGSECKVDDARPRLSGQFQGWQPDAASEKRSRLAQIIYDMSPRLVAIRSAVRWDEFESALGDEFTRMVLHHPYFLCFHGVVSSVLKLALDAPQGVRVAFTFDLETNGPVDQHTKMQYALAQVRPSVPDNMKARMGLLSQDTDINVPLLQVSDFLAWGIRRELEGIACPILSLIRDTSRLAACVECDARPSGYAQLSADIDEKARAIAQRTAEEAS